MAKTKSSKNQKKNKIGLRKTTKTNANCSKNSSVVIRPVSVALTKLTTEMINTIVDELKKSRPYNLRQRKEVVYSQTVKQKPRKQKNQLIKSNNYPSNIQKLWAKCQKQSFVCSVDQICLSKMATYWPYLGRRR